jgi:hypothetical protein
MSSYVVIARISNNCVLTNPPGEPLATQNLVCPGTNYPKKIKKKVLWHPTQAPNPTLSFNLPDPLTRC